MQDFEKLGAFYLGKRVDADSGESTDEMILYDSGDLTTHAVIIGMTGSGKTGLGVGLIEEAAIDHVPVLAIDPKGDLGNLMLTFPQLRGADFEPWIDPQTATQAGQDVASYAASTAKLWKNGLAEWGQTPARIKKLRDAADFSIYTPGSTAGQPISVLGEFGKPSDELMGDSDLYREHLQSTASGILTLLRIDADPLTSREHILVANVLDHAWQKGVSLDLAGLIGSIQSPGFDKIGIMELDTFYPAKDRFALAMRLNNLLAAPGFDAWMQGVPLDMDTLLYTDSGKPRVSIMSIAHLDDAERMFFVTMLLNELIGWMRRQSGSSALRAILYMDEIFGYLPPVANPPSKRPFLTLLKQARAYGVGLVLATQNPVDLDYKGLSNTGTWCIGRLQTERDTMRVRDGLQAAAGSENLPTDKLEHILAGLGKRRFLLHNVHEREPVMFQTRWVMSYLAGPMTREQIKRLMADRITAEPQTAAKAPAANAEQASSAPPLIPPGIEQCYLPPTRLPAAGEPIVYSPQLVCAAEIAYSNARYHVDERRSFMLAIDVDDDSKSIDWSAADEPDVQVDDFENSPAADALYAECPAPLLQAKNYRAWEKDLRRWLRGEKVITLYRSKKLKETSRTDESEKEFRIRLQQLGNEIRDQKVAKLRKRYDKKVVRLEDRLRRAQQAVEREAEQARGAKLDTAISFGTAVLGALLGRKRVSVTSASRVGTAARKAGRIGTQAADVKRAEATVAAVSTELEELQLDFDGEVDALDDAYDAQTEELTEVPIRPLAKNIHVSLMRLGWNPG
jgi:hypothetical protein